MMMVVRVMTNLSMSLCRRFPPGEFRHGLVKFLLVGFFPSLLYPKVNAFALYLKPPGFSKLPGYGKIGVCSIRVWDFSWL
jgi:hypothetical protein